MGLICSNKGKYYLYRYIREDKNEVFYIGIGTKHSNVFKTEKQEYRRAFHKHNRSKYFLNIINKTPYVLEILVESNNYKFIKDKEIEFISLYKRISEGGTLVNFSIGGEGGSGIIKSKKEKEIMSNRMIGGLNPQSKSVIDVITGVEYNSVIEASLASKFKYSTLLDKLSNKKINNSKFISKEDYDNGLKPRFNYIPKNTKRVIDLDSNKIFKTSKECAKYFNKHPSYITQILKGNIKPKKKPINIQYYDSKE